MKHILVVDDNKTNLAAAKAALADIYKVTPVLSGVQALKFMENNTPDLILLDINMPEMDGFEVLSMIQEKHSDKSIPVIFLTADNDAATENRCLELGALDFIAKPFVPNVMRARIARILELEDLRKSLADRLEKKTQEVDEMKSKNSKDALTGLWNRAYTEEKVNAMLREGMKGALFMMDMDNFKAINDTYGHQAGDNALRMFADTLRDHAGENDVVCRIGGDEFVMFVGGVTSKAELGKLAGQIISEMVVKIDEAKYETNTSVSVGIAQIPEDGRDFAKAYNAGDKALYLVKQNGKNSYHFFSEQKDEENNRANILVDVKHLCESVARQDSTKGAYIVDYDNFHHLYNIIRRFVERTQYEVSTVLFTTNYSEELQSDGEAVETVLQELEGAIFKSLRQVDVFARYSSRQLIVILINANEEYAPMVAERIIGAFRQMHPAEDLTIDYEIARMEKKLGR
ncbi:MAG: diguanylate cyclase [Lachnospiraceae bacterium]|nr:diguanylate cyclase [Lachnospiraceae bacterium]